MSVLGAKKCPDLKTVCYTTKRGHVGAREWRAVVEIHQALEWAVAVHLSSAGASGLHQRAWSLQPALWLLAPSHPL